MEWLSYLLKVSACMAMFYALYYFFLQNLTFFSWNRFYLLSSLLLSFMIPMINIQWKSEEISPITKQPLAGLMVTGLKPISDINVATPSAVPDVINHPQTNWPLVLNNVYWTITATVLSIMLFQLATLLWHSRKVVAVVGRLKVVQKAGRYSNCSFLHYIFLDQQRLDDETLYAVMHHESVHADSFHSADKLLLAICKALLWFNPIIYLYSRALEQAHEFEADKKTSARIGDTTYANLLLTLAVGNRQAPLVHSFVNNPIKERISMLFTNQSKNMKKLTYLSLLPAGLALSWFFSVEVVYAQSRPTLPENPMQISGSINSPSLSIRTEPAPVASMSKGAAIETPDSAPVAVNAGSPPRLLDNVMLGDDPLVIIDGKKYTAEILTRISPACVKISRFSHDRAEITTKDNQVKYATKAEVATAKIRLQMKGNGKFFNRYPVTINNRMYDETLIRSDAASMEASFPKGYRIMLLIDGKVYNEEQAKSLPATTALNIKGLNYRYADDDAEVKSKYGDRCDVLIEVKKLEVLPGQEIDVTRNAASSLGEDALGRLYFSAKDSTVVDKEKGVLTLYGDATLQNTKFELSAEKIVFDKASQTAAAENVTYKVNGINAKAAFAKFDLYNGTYEILTAPVFPPE